MCFTPCADPENCPRGGGGVIDNEVREGVRGLFLVLLRYEFNGFGFQGGQDPQPIFRSVQVYKTCKQMIDCRCLNMDGIFFCR